MATKIKREALRQRIKELAGLTDDERAALLELVNTKKFGLVWENHPEDVEERLRTSLPVLEEVKERYIPGSTPDSPNHILIEGDNLEALTALTYTHEGKIDVIYIDPPYNTGKIDEFKYNDKYIDSEDVFRHSKWLSFIEKRIKIARQLLTNQGVLIISIDDNELAQLKILCDSLFNQSSNPKESNCLGILIWDLGTGTQAGHFTRAHEYVLVYAKDKTKIPNFSGGNGYIDHSALKKISKKNPPVDYLFKKGTKFLASDGTELFGKWGGSESTELIDGRMVCENQKLKYDVKLRAGFAMINQMKTWFNGDFTIDSKGQHVIDFYFNSSGILHYVKDKSVINPPSVIKDIASTKTGSSELTNIIGKGDSFNYPKPTSLISWLISLYSNNNTILDFFAGSGTTMHAVMQLNKEDGGHRQCILVTNNEKNICEEVTYERNKRVINGYTTPKGVEVEGLHNNSLRYYKTKLLPRQRTNRNMHDLMNAATDLLCIKEDIYKEQTINGLAIKNISRHVRLFSNGNRYMLVIYNEEAIPRVVPWIATSDFLPEERIKVYTFSYNNYAYDDDFAEVEDRVQLCALPAAIYEAYRRVLPKENRYYDDEPIEGKEDEA